MEELNLFIKSIFIDNMIFAYFLGMCSFLAVSKNVKTAFGLGIAVTFMLVVTLPINYMLDKYVLQEGALTWLSPSLAGVDLSFLGLILFIVSLFGGFVFARVVIESYTGWLGTITSLPVLSDGQIYAVCIGVIGFIGLLICLNLVMHGLTYNKVAKLLKARRH